MTENIAHSKRVCKYHNICTKIWENKLLENMKGFLRHYSEFVQKERDDDSGRKRGSGPLSFAPIDAVKIFNFMQYLKKKVL